MRKLTLLSLSAISAILFSFTAIEASTWSLDKSHAKLGFSITHLLVSDVEGSFRSFESKITSTKADFSDAVVELTADANSVDTDNDKRDEHIRNADFLETSKFPTLTFKSTSFKKLSGNNYKVKGNLTLHGVTKPVELNAVAKTGVNPMSKKTIAGFKITGTIKRSDFGIGAKFPAAVLSDEITLNANAEFIKN
ncbi:YceI family protein [Desertivirga xinjiangensis]|uniref:YceI family protein n=1 Tax=Desertivirga xinjiangensis TaxID=539206 RepID=UPI00210B5558|nr:YceI family protein [Pedobacter xinjiangensis]